MHYSINDEQCNFTSNLVSFVKPAILCTIHVQLVCQNHEISGYAHVALRLFIVEVALCEYTSSSTWAHPFPLVRLWAAESSYTQGACAPTKQWTLRSFKSTRDSWTRRNEDVQVLAIYLLVLKHKLNFSHVDLLNDGLLFGNVMWLL